MIGDLVAGLRAALGEKGIDNWFLGGGQYGARGGDGGAMIHGFYWGCEMGVHVVLAVGE